jgi:hypothetical protein
MKQLIYLAVSIQIALISCSGGGHKAISVKDSNVIVNDTFFIKRDIYKDTIVCNIFIDSNKKSSNYGWVWGLDKTDSNNVKYYISEILKKHFALKKINTYGLATEWRPVYQLHSKYYLYQPSDSGNKGTRILSDSLFMIYYMDGYSPQAIESVTKENNYLFKIKLHDYLKQLNTPSDLTIYVIDPKSKLAIWEYKTGPSTTYELMVPKENEKLYSSVIIHSEISKQQEFDFEKVDYQKLINRVKGTVH